MQRAVFLCWLGLLTLLDCLLTLTCGAAAAMQQCSTLCQVCPSATSPYAIARHVVYSSWTNDVSLSRGAIEATTMPYCNLFRNTTIKRAYIPLDYVNYLYGETARDMA